jgi:hypothetical protein
VYLFHLCIECAYRDVTYSESAVEVTASSEESEYTGARGSLDGGKGWTPTLDDFTDADGAEIIYKLLPVPGTPIEIKRICANVAFMKKISDNLYKKREIYIWSSADGMDYNLVEILRVSRHIC